MGRAWLIDVAWLAAFALLSSAWCLTAAGQIGPTFDEPFYLEGGLHFWRTGSFGMLLNKGAMPLPMAVCTAPLRVYELWRGTPIDLASEFDLALSLARPATLLFWWMLLVYGYVAGRRVGGPWGGRLAVALLACEPTLLAHASLATTDVAITACLLAFAVHFHANRDAGWFRRVGSCALLYGLALFAKASALAFGVLVMVTLDLPRLWTAVTSEQSIRPRVLACLRCVLDAAQIVWLGLVVACILCGSDWQAEPSFVAWAKMLPDDAFGQSMRWLSEHLTVFSNAGVAIVRQIKHNMQGHGAYLLGATSPRALWYFFPVALTIKFALPLLLLPLALLGLSPGSLRNRLVALAVVLLVFSLNCRVQIGVRLVMPLMALVAVGIGAALGDALARLEPDSWRKRLLSGASALGVVWMAGAPAAVWPHGLCYVNELWGGPSHGYECVSGSDYDWGQGVRELDRWRAAKGRDVALLYYGTDPVARSGRFALLHPDQLPPPDDLDQAFAGRDLAVSVSLLYGPRLKADKYRPDRLNPLLDELRTREPSERTRFFVIYRFGNAQARAQGRGH
jgi:hypothetical protein